MTRTVRIIGAGAAVGIALLLVRKAVASGRSDPRGLPADLEPWRRSLVECARRHVEERTLYQWGGGHHGPSWGLDCSGLIIDCAGAAGFSADGWGSARMWAELPRVDEPQPGDIASYAPRHVVLVESWDPATQTATIIGSNGGDSSTTTPERAIEQGAFVRREPTHLYRQTFRGFSSLRPLVEGSFRPTGPYSPYPVDN